MGAMRPETVRMLAQGARRKVESVFSYMGSEAGYRVDP